MKPILLAAALAWSAASALAHAEIQRCPARNFTADPAIARLAGEYALDAKDYAQQTLEQQLDDTDASVEKVEAMLDEMVSGEGATPLSAEQTTKVAKMFGSYVGEVYRRNHGAIWGMAAVGDENVPGLCSKTGMLYAPWGKVRKRLAEGPEENVWLYYRAMVDETPAQ
jgi:hypothetical protein